MFMNAIKPHSILQKKNKHLYQTWNTKGNIDVKEQIRLSNIKYLRLSTKHFMGISILYETHLCTISKVIVIN